ncbi:MAG: hypothetical protein V3T05_05850, partial [Myxococcota bacterium]
MRRGFRGVVLFFVVGGLAPLGCESSRGFTARVPAQREVVGRGVAYVDPAAGTIVFEAVDAAGNLLDVGDALPGGVAASCEPAIWNPGSLVLSANVRMINGSASINYLAPVEWRLTGIQEAWVIQSINTDLANAGCGTSGLTLAGDDLDVPPNGRFDCIFPDDASNTADDPGWDYSSTLGSDNMLTPGEGSACRFVHFNLISETPFSYWWELLGVVDNGWPPSPPVDPVATPTKVNPATVTGRCVTTSFSPDV